MKRFKADDFKVIEKYHKVNELLESSNVYLCKNTDDKLIVSTDFFTGSDFADLPEISVLAEYKHCDRCGMRKKCITSIRAKNKICYLCSLTCLKEFLEEYSDFVIKHLKVTSNFYPDRCLNCRKVVSADCVIAMMQRFCNGECLDMHQKRFFNSCFLCEKPVGDKEMGRFCFYRNQRMFQLCGQDCQETFKQHKTCQFCGQSLNEKKMFSVFLSKSRKNFCNAECHRKFEQHSEKTDITKRHCGICQATDLNDHYIVIELKICKLFACSRVCFYIFFEMNSMICGKVIEPYYICMYCRKLFLRNTNSAIAFNKKCHLFRFCSELCKWILIWSQSRERFGNCDTCLAKKHFYDFIYFREDDQCQAFCSIYCHKLKKKVKISDQSLLAKMITPAALLQSHPPQTAIFVTGTNSAPGSTTQLGQPVSLPIGGVMRFATPLNVSVAADSDNQTNGSSLKQLLLLNTSKTLRQIRPAPPVNANQLVQQQGALKTVSQLQNVKDPPKLIKLSSPKPADEAVKKIAPQDQNVKDPPQLSKLRSPKPADETVKKTIPQLQNVKDPPQLSKVRSPKPADETVKKTIPQLQNVKDPPQLSKVRSPKPADETVKKTILQLQNVKDPPQLSKVRSPKPADETVKKTIPQLQNVKDPPKLSKVRSPKLTDETVKKTAPQLQNVKDPPKLSSQKPANETIKKSNRSVSTREIGVQTDFEDLEVKKDCQDKGTQTYFDAPIETIE